MAQTTPMSSTSPAYRGACVVGGLAIAVAFGFSALLSYGSLPGMTTPGCGPEAGCGKLAESDLGTLFGLWSSAYLGFAYFAAIGTVWAVTGSKPIPSLLAWAIRLGFVGSLIYLGAMVESGELCVFCLASHIANAFLLISVEVRVRLQADRNSSPLMAWAAAPLAAFILSSIALGVTDGVLASQLNEKQNKALENDTNALIAGGNGTNDDEQRRIRPEPVSNDTLDADIAQSTDDSSNSSSEDSDGQYSIPLSARTQILRAANLPSSEIYGDGRAGFTGRYLMGPSEARARIVMFSNPLCPSCRKLHKEIAALIRSRDDVSLSLKQFPLESTCNPMVAEGAGFQGACGLSAISEAAGIIAGPEGYWAITEWLYDTLEQNNGKIDIRQINAYAQSLGIDQSMLQSLSGSDRVSDYISADIDEGLAAGITRTPFVIVNGTVLRQWTRRGDLTRSIMQALNSGALQPADASNDVLAGAIENLTGFWRAHPSMNPNPPAVDFRFGTTDDPAAIQIDLWGDYSDETTKLIDELIQARIDAGKPISYGFRFYPRNPMCNPMIRRGGVAQACDMAFTVAAAAHVGGREAYGIAHDLMMQTDPASINRAYVVQLLEDAGVDGEEGFAAVLDPNVRLVVTKEITEHTRLNIRAGTLLLINGRRVQWRNLEEIEAIIDSILSEVSR